MLEVERLLKSENKARQILDGVIPRMTPTCWTQPFIGGPGSGEEDEQIGRKLDASLPPPTLPTMVYRQLSRSPLRIDRSDPSRK